VATFGDLIAHVKAACSMPAVRTTLHSADRPVRRIGLPWGGLGLFVNVSYVQTLIDLGVDTLICGETDNYGLRFAAELDIAVMETSHEISEEQGLKLFADRLRDHFDIEVRFIETPCVWHMA
jgi:putative NIF3 family GTP cyclohydrolase 1 type 2